MTAFSDMVYALGGVPLLPGIPFGPLSKVYFVDPANGNNANDGETVQTAVADVATAYAKTTANQNDVVVFIGGPTASNPTAGIVWSKSYTHLVGISTPISMGQRCRIVNTAANDLATLFTLSGNGCVMKNIQLFDGKDSAADGACGLVSGNRNYFENCFIAGMGDATASGPATRSGSYSLKVSGAENKFVDCTVGLDTVIRTAANAELVVSGPRNRFVHCDFRSYSETAGKFLVKIDSTVDLRDTIFDNCLFFNYTVNYATGITDAFNIPAGSTHYVILKGNCMLVGVGSGWADTVTYLYHELPAPATGGGVGIAVNT
jgi:hypothetical protein